MSDHEGTPRGNWARALARQSDVPNQVLSDDVELRAPGTEAVSASRLLAPRVGGWIRDLEEQLRGLKRLAAQAEREGNAITAAALAAKTADVLVRVLGVALAAAKDVTAPGVISRETLPDWNALPREVRTKVAAAIDALDAYERGGRLLADE
jgi:hypothetical protein